MFYISGKCNFEGDKPTSSHDLILLIKRWELLSNGNFLLIPEARCVVNH